MHCEFLHRIQYRKRNRATVILYAAITIDIDYSSIHVYLRGMRDASLHACKLSVFPTLYQVISR